MSRPRSFALPTVACLALLARPSAVPAQDPFDLVGLADGVWAAVVVESPPMAVFSNALVVVGEEGVLVVDTHQSPSAAEWLIGAIRARTDRPVRWVVNTHWHGDHVQGNAAYREAFPDVEFVGHVSLAEDVPARAGAKLEEERASLPGSIAERERWLDSGVGPDGAVLTPEDRAAVERSLGYRRRYRAEIEDLEIVPPTTTLEDAWTLRLGDRRVRVLHLGPGHTRGDVVVHLPDDGILAVGDLLEEGLPWIDEDSDVAGWARALDRIEAMDASILLPAHGGVQRDDALLETFEGVLGALAGSASAAAEAGEGVGGLLRRLDSAGWGDRLTGGDPRREAVLDQALERWAAIALEQARAGR